MVPLTGPILLFKRCSGVWVRFALWCTPLKINKRSSVFLHKHLRHVAHAVALHAGLSPGSDSSGICMRYGRGSHANQFHHQCSNLLCVTDRTVAFSLECWTLWQKKLGSCQTQKATYHSFMSAQCSGFCAAEPEAMHSEDPQRVGKGTRRIWR